MDLNEVSDEEMADEMVFGGKKPVEDIIDLQEEVTEEMAEEMFSGSGKPVKVITESIEPNRPNSTVECTSSTNWDTNTSKRLGKDDMQWNLH